MLMPTAPPTGERGGLPAAAAAAAPPPAPGEFGRVGDGVRTLPLVDDSARRLLRGGAEVRGTGQAREHDRVAAAAATEAAAAAAADGEEGGDGDVGGRGSEAERPGDVGVGEILPIRGGEAGQLAGTPAAAVAAAESMSPGDVGGGDEPPSPPPSPPCWSFSLSAAPAEGDGVEEEGADCTLYVTTSSNSRWTKTGVRRVRCRGPVVSGLGWLGVGHRAREPWGEGGSARYHAAIIIPGTASLLFI